jgi:NADP-dependent 3-hydroxy acid dehydrogenase YdfG
VLRRGCGAAQISNNAALEFQLTLTAGKTIVINIENKVIAITGASSTIRVTIIAPGATESELPNAISDPDMKQTVIERFRVDLIPAAAIARAIAYAVEQPADVDVNEIVVRPTAQKY